MLAQESIKIASFFFLFVVGVRRKQPVVRCVMEPGLPPVPRLGKGDKWILWSEATGKQFQETLIGQSDPTVWLCFFFFLLAWVHSFIVSVRRHHVNGACKILSVSVSNATFLGGSSRSQRLPELSKLKTNITFNRMMKHVKTRIASVWCPLTHNPSALNPLDITELLVVHIWKGPFRTRREFFFSFSICDC